MSTTIPLATKPRRSETASLLDSLCSNSENRQALLLQKILRDNNWPSQDAAWIATPHRGSLAIASLFALMQPHQRPTRKELNGATALIHQLGHALTFIASQYPSAKESFCAASLTRRVLSPLYFPQAQATWCTALDAAIHRVASELALCELNECCDRELIPYVESIISQELSVDSAIRNEFQIDLQQLGYAIKQACFENLVSIRSIPDSQCHWPIIFPWSKGDSTIALPTEMECIQIDWQAIEKINQNIVQEVVPSIGNKTHKDRVSDQTEFIDLYAQGLGLNALAKSMLKDVHRIEIRMLGDKELPQIHTSLLENCRQKQCELSLLQIRGWLAANVATPPLRSSIHARWQQPIANAVHDCLQDRLKCIYSNSEGDLVILVDQLSRTELLAILRGTLLNREHMVATGPNRSDVCLIACGVASVESPTRNFQFDQLLSAAERCLQGALLQGRNAIKGLDVY